MAQLPSIGKSICVYPNPLGFGPLRESLARYLALGRGIACSPAQIIITAGYKGALELATLVLLKRGDTVWMEDPGYGVASGLLTAMGVKVASVPVDTEGICIAAAEAMAAKARLAVVTPSHQFPTCVTMSLPRRQALLGWAERERSWIIEDDYDGEFHYAGRPLPALKSIDRGERVLYAGSFSKTLYPGVRLGYLILPSGWSHASRPSCNCAIWGRQRTCRPWPQALWTKDTSAATYAACATSTRHGVPP